MLNCVYFFFWFDHFLILEVKVGIFNLIQYLLKKQTLSFQPIVKSWGKGILFAFLSMTLLFLKYSKASRYTTSSCTDLDSARFWIGSKNTWESRFLIFFSWDTCFCTFFDKWVLEMHVFDKMSTWDARFCRLIMNCLGFFPKFYWN